MFVALTPRECLCGPPNVPDGWLLSNPFKMPFTFSQMFRRPSSPEICGASRIGNRRALAGFRIGTVVSVEKRYRHSAVEHIMVRLRHNLGLALLLATGLCLGFGESPAQTAAPSSATPATGAHPQKGHARGKKPAAAAEDPPPPPPPLTPEQMNPTPPQVTYRSEERRVGKECRSR